MVYLNILLIKEVMRFEFLGKISTRYMGLYPIVGKVGLVAYQVQLQAKLVVFIIYTTY